MGTIESRVDKTVSKLESQLELWGAKLKVLAAKTEVAGQEAKIDSRKRVDELQAKLAVTQAKLQAARAAGADKWDTFKRDVESSWKELEGAFEKLAR
jgi:hypothetical protein